MRPDKMTSDQAAKFLGVAEITLRIWRSKGKGPKFKKSMYGRGGTVTYHMADLRKWKEENL